MAVRRRDWRSESLTENSSVTTETMSSRVGPPRRTEKTSLRATWAKSAETADADINNNHYPRKIIESRVEAFKSPVPSSRARRDLMAEVEQGAKKKAEGEGGQ